MWGSTRIDGGGSFILLLFVLTITFCLVSAGIFKANTTIDMVTAYAKKSKDSSGGSSGGASSGIGDSSDKGSSNSDDNDKGRDKSSPDKGSSDSQQQQ
jgi:hypothetical protein